MATCEPLGRPPWGYVMLSPSIKQTLRCWGYLSHYPDAERDAAWVLDRLAERDARIGKQENGLRRSLLTPPCHRAVKAFIG